jgi:hypothetical protein
MRYGSPMRWLATILAAAAISGCTLLQPSSTNGAGAGSGGGSDAGPSVCHTTTTCADCTTCAINGPCSTQYAACESNADCQAIDQCEGVCGFDATCKQQCTDNNPNGASDYAALTSCIDCQQCSTQCAGLCQQ